MSTKTNISKVDSVSEANDAQIDLVGLTREQMETTLTEMDLPRFRAKQLWHWIYHHGVRDFSDMTTISKNLQPQFAEKFMISRPDIATEQTSNDGTRKWLMGFTDGNLAEAVHIPEEDRGAVCISSQVGCTLNCRFCHTGTQRLVRNLTPSEIVGQFMLARDSYNEWPSSKEPRRLTNIVMMGMGEPLYNYDNIVKALHIIMDEEGINISRRRITLSTAGVVPMIPKIGADLGIQLAISLHAVTDDLRNEIVPINKKYPIAELLDACRAYPTAKNSRRITFEYVMLKGINDSPADARELVRLISGIPAKVNLIPFNPWPGSPYECSSDGDIAAFADIVNMAGYSSPVRTPRGRDILAACGQLKTLSERTRKNA
ncbi:MAG: Dual-specificity RNA methyltransferase RlmN [Alphaproteobacteria bacterium MarineAlpha11_Bin1]|nr:MAG: Dual-specificity RNA methyltransferase RlmN [Alphaproteobacteria bacterium MarineAlpha11_Bin1]|tara:strand:- start:796 stop:1914 length:1119 start_codon:yes stop_codon:yes gene_type:complete